MKKAVIFPFTLLIMFMVQPLLAATNEVVFPRALGDRDPRTVYPEKLLALALRNVNAQIRAVPSKMYFNQGRALEQLKEGKGLDVVWSMTSVAREKELRPVRIPIYKGLIGYRIFLVHKENQAKYTPNFSLADLKTARLVQGHDWPDTQILKRGGFLVETSSQYSGLFSMLSQQRVDLFPRSIVEIWAEAQANSHLNIEVEDSLMLKYPTAFYFFVRLQDIKLAQLIEEGLNKALENGSFDKLFHHYHQALLTQVNMPNRKLFELDNPLLPAETPINDARLWYRSSK